MASSQGVPFPPAHIGSLTRSIALVPPAAVPALVSCVLASAPSLSPLAAILRPPRRLPPSHRGTANGGGLEVGLGEFRFRGRDESGDDVGRQLIWRVIVPLLRVTSPNDEGLRNRLKKCCVMRSAHGCHGRLWRKPSCLFVYG